MRYDIGEPCLHCGGSLRYIPGGYIHRDTFATHCGRNGSGAKLARPDWNWHERAER